MKLKNLWLVAMIVSSLFLLASFSVEAADKTISDGIEDVSSVDLTGETTVITSSPDIQVNNLDLTQATYTKQSGKAVLTLQVRGIIEDRGKLMDPNSPDMNFNSVEYTFELITSEQDYTVSYSNKSAQLSISGENPINLTSADFYTDRDTLTVSFTLSNPDETYDNLSVTSTFIKVNLTGDMDPTAFVYLSDIAPNPELMIFEAYAPNIGSVGETIQFNGSVEPFTGQPPYAYQWDFGDTGTSTTQNPTHVYTKEGEYTYTLTITDQADATVSESGTITISSSGGNEGPSNQMILFLAILLIVIVVGIIIIVWIIRR